MIRSFAQRQRDVCSSLTIDLERVELDFSAISLEAYSDAILSHAGNSSHFFVTSPSLKAPHPATLRLSMLSEVDGFGTSLVNVLMQIRKKGGESYEDRKIIFGSPDSSRESRSE